MPLSQPCHFTDKALPPLIPQLDTLKCQKHHSSKPILHRPEDPLIIPSDVKSGPCHCRIMAFNVSCNTEQQNVGANGKKVAFFLKRAFLAIVLVLAEACIFLAWCMGQSLKLDVAVNKDDVEYEERIPKTALGARGVRARRGKHRGR